MANIKKINWGGVDYDLEALHFHYDDTLDTPTQWKTYIDNLAAVGIQLVSVTTLPTASADTMGKIYLVPHAQGAQNAKDEYITIESNATYSWEKIGSTDVDLSGYQKTGITLTTSGNSVNTSSAGAATITSGGTTPTAKATVNFTRFKAGAILDSTDVLASDRENGKWVLKFSNGTFTGTKATITSTGSFTPAGTVSYTGTTAAATGSALTGIKTAGSITTTGTQTVVTGVTAASGTKNYLSVSGGTASLTGTKTFNTDAIKGVTLGASTTSTDGPAYVESVTHTAASLTGTKTFNTDAIKAVSLSASTTTSDGPQYVQAISYTAPSLTGTKTFATSGLTGSYSDGVLTLAAAGTATVGISGGSCTPTTRYMKTTTTAANTGTVGISGGSVTPVTKYMKATTTAASTGTVGLSSTAASLSTATTTSTGAIEYISAVSGGSASGTVTVNKGYTYKDPVFNSGTFATSGITALTGLAFKGTAGTVSVASQYTPAGTLSGTQSLSHQHAIWERQDSNYTPTTQPDPVVVTVSSHTHSVTIANHTHTLNGHTHTVTTKNN